MSEEDKCITETAGFVANCLNTDVLEVSVYEYIHKKAVLGDDEPEHRLVSLLTRLKMKPTKMISPTKEAILVLLWNICVFFILNRRAVVMPETGYFV